MKNFQFIIKFHTFQILQGLRFVTCSYVFMDRDCGNVWAFEYEYVWCAYCLCFCFDMYNEIRILLKI